MFIRNALPQDLAAIVEIYNFTVAGRMVTADLEEAKTADRREWFSRHNTTTRPLWVAEDEDGKITGWLSFENFYGRPAYNGTAEISIYIHPAHYRKGLGKILLHKAMEEAPNMQIENLLGFIFGHNEPSIKLFEKYGFEIWAKLPGIANMEGTRRDLLILGRKV